MKNKTIFTFDDLLAPIKKQQFFNQYYDKKWLHIKASTMKKDYFSQLMSWQQLTEICNMSHIWNSNNMKLVLDRQIIPPVEYCISPMTGNTHMRIGSNFEMIPEPQMIMQWLQKGASLVLDGIDSLTPSLREFSDMLEDSFDARAQSNLYYSAKRHKAFDSHCDTHDVLAVHLIGKKVWNLWQNRESHPINHSDFKRWSQGKIDHAKGKKYTQVCMEPGDILYIPRGWYHDALTNDDYSVHIAFGLTSIIGLDVVDALYEALVKEELFRKNLPATIFGEQRLRQHVHALADTLSKTLKNPALTKQIHLKQREYRYIRGGFSMPVKVDNDNDDASKEVEWSLINRGIAITQTLHGKALKIEGSDKMMPIPPAYQGAMEWLCKQKTNISLSNFMQANIIDDLDLAKKLFIDLEKMNLIHKI